MFLLANHRRVHGYFVRVFDIIVQNPIQSNLLGDTINVYIITSAIFQIIHVINQEIIVDTGIDYYNIS